MNKWEDEDHPLALWDLLNDNKSRKQFGPLSSRKCRLLACARANKLRSRLTDRAIVQLDYAYKFADNPIVDDELEQARIRWQSETRDLKGLNPFLTDAGFAAISGIEGALVKDTGEAELFKAIFYNPFRPPLMCNRFMLQGQDGKRIYAGSSVAFFYGQHYGPIPKWLTAQVMAFAEQLYETQDAVQYMALVDMLEESGCDSPTIMTALREAVCIKGNWALDFILGKE